MSSVIGGVSVFGVGVILVVETTIVKVVIIGELVFLMVINVLGEAEWS
jgi:hypothetical protein